MMAASDSTDTDSQQNGKYSKFDLSLRKAAKEGKTVWYSWLMLFLIVLMRVSH